MSARFSDVLGSFEHMDATIEAIQVLHKAGYRDLTVFSPVWRHELDALLKPAASPVRFFTLLGGLAGCATGFALTIWTSMDWPLRTGAKPIVSIPPFIVIAFELTILLGALGTLLGLLLTAGLPRSSMKTAYDPKLTEDRFGVLVRCPELQAAALQDTLKSLGAKEVRFEPVSREDRLPPS